MSLYLGDERIVEVKTVVNADRIVFEYTYNAETNPAATVQSIEERVKDFVQNETYTADKTAINNSITQAESRVTKKLDAYAETTNITLGTMEVNINKLALAIDGLSSTKQDNLTFDGTYNASTNPVATLQTVANEVAKIVANAPEDLDTLEEIAAWIKDNPGSAAEINALISKNATAISTLESNIENGTVVAKNATTADSATKATQDGSGNNIESTYAKKGVSGKLLLGGTNWSENQQSVTIVDLGTNDAIFFTPATADDKEKIEDADIFISSNGNVVAFACQTVPTSDITFNYFIVRG